LIILEGRRHGGLIRAQVFKRMERIHKILFIEDDALLMKAIAFRLEKEGYNVVLAEDGRKASSLLASESFDLILTEIMLPFVNGLELIRLVRIDLNLTTPIIVLSSVGTEQAVVEVFNLGADDYITKPFSPAELSARIKRTLK